MAFPGFSFYGGDFGLDTYGGEDGGFSAFGNPPPDWMPDLSGISMAPPAPQRLPLSIEDLYQPAPAEEPIPMPQGVGGMGDLSDEERKRLQNDLILQVGLALAQGANSRGPGLAAALGEAAANARAGQEQAFAREQERRQSDYERQVAEAVARREEAQAEAQDARQRQLAGSLTGLANKIAEAEPQAAELADTYARMGQMDDLVSLYQKLPDYAAARAAGYDPFAQPDWRAIEEEKRAAAEKAAQEAADFEEWKRKQKIERTMSREDLQWRQQNGLLFAPSGPEKPDRPQTIETPTGVFERGPDEQWKPAGGIPAYPQKKRPEETERPMRIIEQGGGISSKKYYEDTEKGVLWPVFPDENGNRTPIPLPNWKPPGARKQSRLESPREAPTSGGEVRPAASSGEGGKAQKEPTAEQVEKKLSRVTQSFGPLSPEQKAFVRAELKKGMTAQSILARIRMASQGGPRA